MGSIEIRYPEFESMPRPGSQRHAAAVLAGLAGWTLDVFDFFLVVFCLTAIGQEFHKQDSEVALTIALTLALRPVGAFLFGVLADRYGRRLPLILNILFFSLAEVLTGTAHSFTMFVIFRAMFGIGMGGQWGVGASLAMEQVPSERRGLLSGLFQQGYPIGALLASLSFLLFFNRWGWRPQFFLGSLPALILVIFIYKRVDESEVWERSRRLGWADLNREICTNWKLFLYLSLFMTFMMFSSHGTQDMYPTFLQRRWHLGPVQRSTITAFSMVGAIVGGIVVGHLSDKWGRRRAIVGALVFAMLTIPLWTYAPSVPLLTAGAFLMQFMVHGAFGVIPAHLAELSPDSVRAVLPGLAYQCGVLLSSSIVYLEALFGQRTNYSMAMSLTAAVVFLLATVVASTGTERRGIAFGARPRQPIGST
jgi:SHS family lactate transporter-like MFS transporter